jgi:hypothetical protein
MYKTYLKVAVGPLRDQIEFNKELLRFHLLEEKTSWSSIMSHTPEAEKKQVLSCRNGCCKYTV